MTSNLGLNNKNNIRNLESMLPDFADMLAFYQVYPDLFVDLITPKDSNFKLFPFQRIFLRVLARNKKVY